MAFLAFVVRRHTVVCADTVMLGVSDLRHKTEQGDAGHKCLFLGGMAGTVRHSLGHGEKAGGRARGRSRFMPAPRIE
jgi:hypothetical protein